MDKVARSLFLIMSVMIALSFNSCSKFTFRTLYKPIIFDSTRSALSLSYLNQHYGITRENPTIEPIIVVLHWTDIPTLEATYDVFNKSTLGNSRKDISSAGNLNVSSQYLVDRDGTIFQLLPDTVFARHVIGLNYCAIGVENVGSKRNPLTKAQLKANVRLIKYLKTRFPIQYVIGHYEYKNFIGHPLWKEKDPDYLTQKIDPGISFMKKVRIRIKDLGIKPAPPSASSEK